MCGGMCLRVRVRGYFSMWARCAGRMQHSCVRCAKMLTCAALPATHNTHFPCATWRAQQPTFQPGCRPHAAGFNAPPTLRCHPHPPPSTCSLTIHGIQTVPPTSNLQPLTSNLPISKPSNLLISKPSNLPTSKPSNLPISKPSSPPHLHQGQAAADGGPTRGLLQLQPPPHTCPLAAAARTRVAARACGQVCAVAPRGWGWGVSWVPNPRSGGGRATNACLTSFRHRLSLDQVH